MTAHDHPLPQAPGKPGARPSGPVSPGLRASARMILGVVFVLAVAASLPAGFHPLLGPRVVVAASLVLAAIFGLVLHALPQHGHGRFGYANLVTAIRAAIASFIAAVAVFAEITQAPDALVWVLVALVAVALALDGVDGSLARRYREESALGARFDMEVDAFLILILSYAALALGKAGWWVLAIGLMRYAFVAAMPLVPRLRGELPPSFRRKLVCVVQVAALCLLLVPAIVPPVSTAIAALALVLLAYSFAVDVLYLMTAKAAGR